MAKARSGVTINDVARHAGVSIATVSRAANGRYGVSPATVERVRQAIAELGYESSLVARSLRSQRTGVIGILTSDFEPFSAELLKGAALAVKGTGVDMVVYSGGAHYGADAHAWEQRNLTRLSGTLTDGIILVTPWITDVVSVAPVVAVDPKAGATGMAAVSSANLDGAVMAVEHLIGLGHRRIALIAGRADLESARLRELGYRQALEAAGLPPDPDLIVAGDYDATVAGPAARRLLTMPQPPTAVFAANDLSAISTLEVAAELGLSVPGDVSVVGFDDIPEAARTAPPLTTIEQPIQQMGGEAVRLLLRMIDNPDDEPSEVILPTKIVVRGSTGSPRRSS